MVHPLPAPGVGEDADAFLAFPAGILDIGQSSQQLPHADGVWRYPADLGTTSSDSLACAAQFVAWVARDFLMVAVADQMHRYPATQASFAGGTQCHPGTEDALLTDRLDHLIQLQQRVGQVLTDLHQCLPHALGVQAHQQGDAVGQWVTQVMQHPEPQPADTLTPRYQGQAQAQRLVLPAQQHL
ncbi:hypothetical protein D3C76_1287410 [compost metagenome]